MTTVIEFRGPPGRAAPVPEAPPHPLELAIVVPTLNERDNIVPLVHALDRATAGIAAEIIFVDDWSGDGTADVIAGLARRRADIRLIRRHGRRGLASAVIEGMLSTTCPLVAVVDADMQHDEAILPALVQAVRDGADVAVGTRYADGGSCGEWGAGRALGSRIATGLARVATGVRVSDPLSGFFVIRQDIAARLAPALRTQGFKILLDLLSAARDPLRVSEIPYMFRNRSMGQSKLGTGVVVDYLRLILANGLPRLFSHRALRFGAVGLSGVALNLLLLRLLIGRLGFPAAEAAAVAACIASNFLLNNVLTFRDRSLRGGALWRGLARFYAVCAAGALVSVAFSSFLFRIAAPWWLAGMAGAVVGAGWNFAVSSVLVWRRPPVVPDGAGSPT